MLACLLFAPALYAQSPPAPSDLAASAVSASQINLTWADNSDDEEGFKIERATSSGGSFSEIAGVSANVTVYSDSAGLSANTQYFYRVYAYNAGDSSDYSAEANATTHPNAPSTPAGLAATAMSSSQINLTWTDASSASNATAHFRIERKTGAGGTYTQIDSVTAPATAYSDNGLAEGTQYYYRARAVNVTGHSEYSSEANATTLLNTPASLTATTVSNTRIDLAWTDISSLEDGYKIELSTAGSSGPFTQIAAVGANVQTYSSTGLTPATTYHYRVRAYKGTNHSAYSNVPNATTQPDPPAAPSGLAVTAVSNTQINLTWTDNSGNEDGFKIERKLTSGVTFSQIATVGAGITSYSSTGLSATTSYTYRVRAHNAGGHSGYSNQASATTLIDPPAAPGSLTAMAASNSRIDLTWADNATTETGFKIERKAGAGGTYAQIDSVGANVTSYASAGLTGSTEYYYRVRAYNAGGHSAYSNEANATTLQNPPAAPSGLTATAVSNEQIDLAWADNSDNEDGFKIEIKLGAGGAYIETATVGSDVTSYSSTGLEAGTEYFYRVRAFNGTGHSAYADEDGATTLPEPPAAPTNLAATVASQTQVDLTWTDNANNEDGFRVERKLSSAATYTEFDTVGANVTSFSSTGLAADTEYTYRVRAFNATDNSGYTDEVTVTTLPDPPANAPSSLTATAASNVQIDLAWADNSSDEDGFRIERKAAGDTAYVEIDTVGAEVTSYASTGLAGSTEYHYRVRAFNAGGHSGYSNEANATTLPDPPQTPSALTAAAVSNAQIDLSWTDNSSNEAGFKIERNTSADSATYTEIATVGPNVTSYSSTGLAGSTAYYYRVRSYNANGNSAYSNAASDTTLPDLPAAPSALAAAVMSSAQVDLSWTDNSADEDGFTIELKAAGAGAYIEIDSVGANVTSYSIIGLNPSTQYFFRVRAFNITGNSDYSETAEATTNPDPPIAPGSLTATAVSHTQIDLAWADNSSNESGFKIERKLTSAAVFAEIATVGANVTSFSSTGLSASTSYTHRVRAYNASGNSSYSNNASATTLVTPPAAPSDLTATMVSTSQIDLAWTDNASNEDGFKIERKAAGDSVYAQIAAVGANVTSYADTGLPENMQYFYRVRAHQSGSHSAYSNEAGATTVPNPPAAPSGLTATAASNSQIDLAWEDESSDEDGFIIERKTGDDDDYAVIDSVSANDTTYANTGLSSNTEYYYRVRAYNAGGNSDYADEANATTLPDPPAAPSNLTATAMSNSRIDLAWNDNSSDEDGFKIRLKTAADTAYTEIAAVAAGATAYSSTGLNPSTVYFYQVSAYNAYGSTLSNVASDTTLPDLPATPGSLTATAVSSTKINLAWADQSNNEAGFKIERKLTSAPVFAEIATVGPNVTSYSNTGLSANTSYAYRLSAYNASGNSGYSNTASATTLVSPPAAPSALTAAAVSSSQINLAWTDNASNEDGFKLERQAAGDTIFTEIASLSANVTSYSNTGLNANTIYSYRVRAHRSGNSFSDYSNVASDTTLLNLPAAPSGLTAAAVSTSRINLAWTDNSDNEDGFKIERKTNAGGTYAEIAVAGAGASAFSDTGLAANTWYFYRVQAFNASGNSPYSNEASDTTLAITPTPPNNLAATAVSTTQIDLSWADNSNNEDGFKIERKTGVNGTYAEIANVGAGVTAFSNSGLGVSTRYFYRVRAFNSGGHSAYSNDADRFTLMNAPANLSAAAVSSSRINLTWSETVFNETGFEVERKTLGGTYAKIATTAKNATNYSDLGLSASTEYFYRVRAVNAANVSAYTNEASDTTPAEVPVIPAAPSSLAATVVSNVQINLAWTDHASNEDGFKIELSETAGGPFTEIATVGANVTNYSNTNVQANTQYFHRVRAFNAAGNSAYSNEAGALTLMNAPTNLAAAAVNTDQINLTWSESVITETGFEVQRKTGAAGTYATIATAAKDATGYSDVGLSLGTEYFYRVRAVNAANVSAYTNEAGATTLTSPPLIPIPPENLVATAVSKSTIDLSWADKSNNEDGFKIERKTGANGTYAQIASVGAGVTSFSNANLGVGTRYYYRVRAFNTNGNSAYSGEANAITLMNGPANLAATAVSSSQIDLIWTETVANETGFEIERKTGAGGAYAKIATAAQNATSYSDLGLSASTEYFYRVRAVTAANVSGYTNEAGDTTLAGIPPAPEALAATAASTAQIDLSWADKSNNEDGFKIERKTGVAGTYAEIATVGAGVTTFSNTGLGVNTRYFYRVWAFNALGNSGYSNEADRFTLMNGPANLAATAVSSSRIDLTWAETVLNETGFEVERKTGAGGTYAKIATVAKNATSYSDLGLSANTGYFYRVRAVSATNVSGYTNEANATTGIAKAAGEMMSGVIPEKISLAPNYPNPFNPSTTISYSLPEGVHVSLKVVNLTGSEVATLVDGYRERGVHRVIFKAGKLPSGIYYAVLKAGEITQVQRMTLAK
jgi:titin